MLVKSKSVENGLDRDSFYVVYAFEYIDDILYFYVIKDCIFSFVSIVNSAFFVGFDDRQSVYWCQLPKIDQAINTRLNAFKEWIEDPNFYHKLFEGEAVPGLFTDEEAKEAIQVFQRYKALMDLEFALPSITKYAINLESDNWVMCPTCDEAWQDENATIHEMVKCPKCCEKWLSPLKKA